jgi:hypothetical protein
MQNIRKHYFPADGSTVLTGLLPNGQYGAHLEDSPLTGRGHSRLAAIADLCERERVAGSIHDNQED